MKNLWWMLLPLGILPVFGQEEAAKPWSNKTELSLVGTFGNSESQTLGFGNSFSYKKGPAEFTAKLNGIRAENTKVTRTAMEVGGGISVVEESVTEKTAEKYVAALKYQRKVLERLFWFSGLDWDRNEFAGISNRTGVSAGVGHVWKDADDHKFKTDYGFQYITETPVVEPEGYDDAYMAARVDADWMIKFTPNATFEQSLRTALNLDDSDDYRAALDNGLTVSMKSGLALKVGLQFLYDHQPGFSEIPWVVDGIPSGTIPYQLDEWDTTFTTSLVIDF